MVGTYFAREDAPSIICKRQRQRQRNEKKSIHVRRDRQHSQLQIESRLLLAFKNRSIIEIGHSLYMYSEETILGRKINCLSFTTKI